MQNKAFLTIILPGQIISVENNHIKISVEPGPPPITEKFFDEMHKQLGATKAIRLHDELVDDITERYIQQLIRIESTKYES
jgi:hypothetical protein